MRGNKQIITDVLGMFGDDPDPTVMKVRFGFGEVSDTGEGSMLCAKRG